MISKLGIEEEKVPEMCAELYKEYGTTMAGLRVRYGLIRVCVCVWLACLNVLISTPLVSFFQAVGYDLDYHDYHR